jgi:hypothetical protein
VQWSICAAGKRHAAAAPPSSVTNSRRPGVGKRLHGLALGTKAKARLALAARGNPRIFADDLERSTKDAGVENYSDFMGQNSWERV